MILPLIISLEQLGTFGTFGMVVMGSAQWHTDRPEQIEQLTRTLALQGVHSAQETLNCIHS